MADFTALKTAIQNAIKQNGNEEITGNILQDVLLAIVSTLGDGSINDLITALGSEATTRGNADATLQQNINAEAQARQLADSTLQGGINTVSAAITAINNAIGNGCVYAGIATPSSTPASGKVFYLALTAGTYTNFNSLEVPQGINILKNNGSTWSLDAFVGIDDTPTPTSNKLVKSGGVFNDIMTNGSAFDLSAYNNGTTYADLNAALTALNALPAAYKKGGMSMKFVQSSDNNYVQARCIPDEFTTDITKWEIVDNKPTNESKNTITSGAIYEYVDGVALTLHGGFVGTNGGITEVEESLTPYRYSDILKLKRGVTYRILACTSSSAVILSKWTSQGTYIENLIVGDGTTKERTYTPSVDMFVRFTNNNNLVPVLSVIVNDNVLKYVENADSKQQTEIDYLNNIATNLPLTLHGGYVAASNLAVNPIANEELTPYRYSDYVALKAGVRYKINACTSDSCSVLTEGSSTQGSIRMLIQGDGITKVHYFTPNADMYVRLCSDYRLVEKPSIQNDETIDERINDITDDTYSEGVQITHGTIAEGYVDSGTGKFIPYDDWESAFFNVENYDRIRIVATNDNNARTFAFYFNDTNYVRDDYVIIDGAHHYDMGETIADVPLGAPWLIIHYKRADSASISDIQVYGEKIIRGTDSLIDALPNGQKWVVIGDSLTEKNFRAVTSYYDYVRRETGCSVINKGSSGQGYAKGNYFYNAITSIEDVVFDFVTLFGSGNDLDIESIFGAGVTWEQALGNVSDNGTSSICGFINRAIDHFYDIAPTKKIGIVTPTPWADYYDTETNSLINSRMDDYSNALIEICKRRGIPCLDLFHTSGLRPWSADFRAEYYTEKGVADSGVHPNSKGHKWISAMFKEFIQKYLV